MKRAPEKSPAANSLPTFLDEQTSGEQVETAIEEQGDGQAEDSEEPAHEEAELAESVMDEEAAAEADDAADDPDSEPEPETVRPATSRAPAGSASGGALGTMLGAMMIVAGFVVTLLPNLNQTLPAGLNGAILVVIGTVLLGSGITRRRIGIVERRLEDHERGREAREAAMAENLQFLVDAQGLHHGAPAAGEEVQHALLALQRQDGKLNNLTKALKMYGKPLLDIAGQGTELAGNLAQVRALVEGGAESTRQAVSRIETQLRSQGGAKPELGDLLEKVQKIATEVHTLAHKAAPSIEPLQQQGTRLEVAIAAMAQRLGDNEVQKSLLRLEDATLKAQKEVHNLGRGEVIREVATHLQQRLDAATTQLTDGMTKMREGNLGGLETSMRDVQRTVAGLVTAVAQIQAAVKNGARAAAAAPAPAPAPAPANPAKTPAPQPTATAPASSGPSDGYQTGTRTTGSKNVLGAIAKLKQMKN